MIQYSLKQGFNKFQKVGEDDVSKEIMQLHMRDAFMPQDSKDLSDEQKWSALESLMCLKEERDGSVKGCTCADRGGMTQLYPGTRHLLPSHWGPC
jgi:hypothetical protein